MIKASSGLFFESLSNVEIAPPGEDISISFEAINRSPNNIKLKKIVLLDEEIIIDEVLQNNKLFTKFI